MQNNIRNIFILALLSFLTLLPMIFIGVFEGPDTSQHIQFASTYETAFHSGDFFPSWGANENFGYGSVGVRFYPPIFSILFAFAHALTDNWHTAISLVNLLFTLIGGIGVYLLGREFERDSCALLAGIVFILMPFHLSEIHINSFYAEYAGCSLLPFPFLFVTRICNKNRLLDVFGLAGSFSVLLLTHVPSTVIASIGLLIYSLLIIPKKRFLITFLKLANAAVFALAATSFYWMKVLTEIDWFRNTKLVTDQTFDYNEHFLLTIPSDKVFGIWYNNQILIAVILLVICSLIGMKIGERTPNLGNLRGVIVLFFFSVFMMTPLSYPIWMLIPYLKEVQFPWRWQVVTCVMGSVIIAVGIQPFLKLVKSQRSWRRPFALLAFVSILFGISPFFKIASKYRRDYIPAGKFNAWSEEKTKSLGFEYFWTITTNKNAFLIKERVTAPRLTKIIKWEPTERIFRLEPGEAGTIRISTLFYPHWKASVNDVPSKLILNGDGTMGVTPGSNASLVRLWFEEPWFIDRAFLLSGSVWIFFLLSGLFLCIVNLKKRFRNVSTTGLVRQ